MPAQGGCVHVQFTAPRPSDHESSAGTRRARRRRTAVGTGLFTAENAGSGDSRPAVGRLPTDSALGNPATAILVFGALAGARRRRWHGGIGGGAATAVLPVFQKAAATNLSGGEQCPVGSGLRAGQ